MFYKPIIITLFMLMGFGAASQSVHTASGAVSKTKIITKWIVGTNSTLRVLGKSNINTFTCSIQHYTRHDTLVLSSNGKGIIMGLNGELVLDVITFDCHHKMITSDLRKTLKAKAYPILKVQFLSLEKMPDFTGQNLKGWVEVELAGIKKLMQIPFQFTKSAEGMVFMNGMTVFCFSDFKLVPPTKIAGAVKIKDEFTVDFRLQLKMLD